MPSMWALALWTKEEQHAHAHTHTNTDDRQSVEYPIFPRVPGIISINQTTNSTLNGSGIN